MYLKEAKIGGYSSHHFQRLQESAKTHVNEYEYTKNWKNVFADVCIFSVPPPSIGIVSVPLQLEVYTLIINDLYLQILHSASENSSRPTSSSPFNLCLHIGHKGTIFPRHFGVIVFHTHIIIYLIFPIIAQRIDSLTSSLQSWTKERSEASKGLFARYVAEEHRSAALMLL